MEEFVKIVKKIVEEKDLREEEVLKMIDEKQEEFEGIISKVGAAYVVAKELGVNLKEFEEDEELKIKDLTPGMSSVNIKVKVVRIFDETRFTRKDGSEGKVKNILVGDETGITRLVLWDEQIDDFDYEEGDVIEIIRAYTKETYNGNVELRLGNYGLIKKIDEKIEVKDKDGGEVVIREYLNKNIVEINKDKENISIKGYFTRLFRKEPVLRFCPKCKKRIEGEKCNIHNIESEKLLILSGIIDDGTSSIIVNFFRQDAEKLAGMYEEEIEEVIKKEGKDAFYERVEQRLLKGFFKIKGTVKVNDYNNTLEVTVHNFKELKEVI